MHECEFCFSQFTPRPQVKNARACGKRGCQQARQKSNEKAWHAKNPGLYDGKYHQVQRISRIRRIREVAHKFSNCLKTGATMLGVHIEGADIFGLLLSFFSDLGIRSTNKFCKP